MIGIFDSGSGGLSVASEIVKLMPHSNILYIGDIKNMPYGNKSELELFTLTKQLIQFLKNNGCDILVSACNSISTQVITNKFFNTTLPIIEMVQPTVTSLQGYTNKKIAIVATPATITSGMYQKKLQEHAMQIYTIANAHLAKAIEYNDLKNITNEITKITQECADNHIDILSLSCTHYPLVIEIFNEVRNTLKIPLAYFDPSLAVAHEVKNNYSSNEQGIHRAYTTAPSPTFTRLLKQKLPHATHGVISL